MSIQMQVTAKIENQKGEIREHVSYFSPSARLVLVFHHFNSRLSEGEKIKKLTVEK